MSSAAEKDSVICALINIDHPVIVELGAHIGEEYEWLRNLKPSRYVMVEPDPVNVSILLKKAFGTVSILDVAVGSYNAPSTIFYASDNHVSKNRASGSIRNPTGHLKHFPEVTFSVDNVMLYTLDSICEIEQVDHIDLLWCDIQGAERDMIEGGRATLRKTRYMMIEAEPDVELYEGQALKPELIAMLPDWEVIKDFGYNVLLRNTKYAI